jgi:hypothetical protein
MWASCQVLATCGGALATVEQKQRQLHSYLTAVGTSRSTNTFSLLEAAPLTACRQNFGPRGTAVLYGCTFWYDCAEIRSDGLQAPDGQVTQHPVSLQYIAFQGNTARPGPEPGPDRSGKRGGAVTLESFLRELTPASAPTHAGPVRSGRRESTSHALRPTIPISRNLFHTR